MKCWKFLFCAPYLFILILLGGCGSGEPDATATAPPPIATPTSTPSLPTATPTPQLPTLMDRLADVDQLSIFRLALTDAKLTERLSQGGPYTLFAPMNAAFGQLPDGVMDDPNSLSELMRFHIVDQNVSPAMLAQSSTLIPLLDAEAPLTITYENEVIHINDALLIDDDSLPNNPIVAQNGTIYLLDKVLIPPTLTLLTIQSRAPVANALLPNLWQVVQAESELSTFLDGLEAAGLKSLLEGEDSYTLFAPTDRAFEQLVERAPAELLKQLDEDPKMLLQYHMSAGYLATSAVQDGLMLPTLEGNSLIFADQENNGQRQLIIRDANSGDARFVGQELPARNGVIHVIDAVLQPK